MPLKNKCVPLEIMSGVQMDVRKQSISVKYYQQRIQEHNVEHQEVVQQIGQTFKAHRYTIICCIYAFVKHSLFKN